MIAVRPEREGVAGALAEIRAKKRAHPGATALRNRNHDRVTARELARAAAQIPTAKTATSARINRFSRNPRDLAEEFDITPGETFERILLLD